MLSSTPGCLHKVNAIKSCPIGYFFLSIDIVYSFFSSICSFSFQGCSSHVSQHGRIDGTAFQNELQLKDKARVILIHNVNVPDKFSQKVNLARLQDLSSHRKKKQIYVVLVRFDDVNVGTDQCKKYSRLAALQPRSVPIFEERFTYNLGSSGKHLARATLVQLPHRLAWGITCHKVQGQTFGCNTKIVIQWSKGLPAGMVYVMLSRSKRIEDIFINGNFDPKQIRCDFTAKLMCEQLEARSDVFCTRFFPSEARPR